MVIQTLNSNLAIYKLSCTSSQALRVLYSVTVMPDYGWTLTVYGRQVDPNQCSLLCDVPMQLTSETLQSMLLLLHECNIYVLVIQILTLYVWLKPEKASSFHKVEIELLRIMLYFFSESLY